MTHLNISYSSCYFIIIVISYINTIYFAKFEVEAFHKWLLLLNELIPNL